MGSPYLGGFGGRSLRSPCISGFAISQCISGVRRILVCSPNLSGFAVPEWVRRILVGLPNLSMFAVF